MTQIYFSAFYPDESAVGVLGSTLPAAAKSRIQAIIESLETVIEDSIITKDEKIRILIPLNAELSINYSDLIARGAEYFIDMSELIDAYDAWIVYRDSLDPAWNDVNNSTTIDRDEFREIVGTLLEELRNAQNKIVKKISDDLAEAVAVIDNIQSDNWLSRNEKPEIIRIWESIQGEYPVIAAQALANGITLTYNNYVLKYNALEDYLDSLDPAFDDLTENTPIDGTVFRQKFVQYYTAKQDVLSALITAAQTAAEIAAVNAQNALSQLSRIASDSWLSKGEKPAVILQWNIIAGEYSGLRQKGIDIGATTQVTAYETTKGALESYLASLSPAWNNLSEDTPIVGTTFNQKFYDYYLAKQSLINAIAGILDTDINNIVSSIQIITSDNWLSRGEKPQVIREYNMLLALHTPLVDQATALSVPSTTYVGAWNSLTSYLNGLSPAWNDLTQDTQINGNTFAANFNYVYAQRALLEKAIITKVNATAQTAATNANNALTNLSRIASDSWLTAAEKSEIIRQWAVINGEYQNLYDRAAAIGAAVQASTYQAAKSALQSYLQSLTPSYNDLTQDTPITGSTFNQKFYDYYIAKQSVINAIAGILDSNVSTALSQLQIIGSDNWLSKGEKPAVIREYNDLESKYTPLINQADGLAVSRSAYTTARNDLVSYLTALSPAWNDATVDTPIVAATFSSKFGAVYTAKSALEVAIAAKINTTATGAANNATAALATLDRISSDSWLSKGEKPAVIREYAVIQGEYNLFASRAISVGATTQASAINAAVSALASYLTSLSPTWNDVSQDTPIVAATFNQKFYDYYLARQASINAVDGILDTDIGIAIGRLDLIDSDGVLSKSEKPEIINRYNQLYAMYQNDASRATTLNITSSSAWSAYSSAVTSLTSYLNSLSPAWNNTSTDTNISAITFSQKFLDVYNSKSAFEQVVLETLNIKINTTVTVTNGIYQVQHDANGRMTGFASTIDPNTFANSFKIHSDFFEISKPGGGARTTFANGKWVVYDDNNIARVELGVLS